MSEEANDLRAAVNGCGISSFLVIGLVVMMLGLLRMGTDPQEGAMALLASLACFGGAAVILGLYRQARGAGETLNDPPVAVTSCATCAAALEVGADVVLCGTCEALSHRACWSRGCGSTTCRPALEVSSRARVAELRCPFCHDDLSGASAEEEACVGCGTRYHRECFAEQGCGTLGCGERREAPQRS